MCVQCDVCGLEPAAVLCCADEAAFCSPCNRRVHRANKLAGKHRRLTLLQPDPAGDAAVAAAPLCDVCKERRGLVFCVEDRAILCTDCDEPIHSAKDLTAKHSRFLLVGARLSADPVDKEIPFPDESFGEHDDCSASAAKEAPAIHYDSQGSPCSSGRTSQPHRRGPPLLVTCSCAAPLGDAGFAREVARKQIGGVEAPTGREHLCGEQGASLAHSGRDPAGSVHGGALGAGSYGGGEGGLRGGGEGGALVGGGEVGPWCVGRRWGRRPAA